MDAVPLVIQLVGSVRELRRFLHSISEAPGESRRLIDLLEQLEFILEQVGMLAQRELGNTRLAESGILASVLKAVNSCERKLAMLEAVVETTKKALTASNRATRTLGSLKLACRKKDMQGMEQQLNEAVNLLSLTMMVNLTSVCSEGMEALNGQLSSTHQTTNTVGHELILLRHDLANTSNRTPNEARDTIKGAANNLEISTMPRSRIIKEQSIVWRRYHNLFGKLLVRKVSRFADFTGDDAQPAQMPYSTSTSSWSFVPSFLSRAFDYQSLTTFGSIQRSIRIYPVISGRHPIWGMCRGGDLKGIQTLLRTRQVSPFSVDENGQTLLHVATELHRVKICEFLFDLGLNGQQTSHRGFLPIPVPLGTSIVDLSCDISYLTDLYLLFTSRCEYFEKEDFFSILFDSFHLDVAPKTFNSIVNELASKVTIDSFQTSPVCTAMRMFYKSEPEFRDAWRESIHRLLALGTDLHRSYEWGGGTVLDQILGLVECPFESQELGEYWLSILEDFGLDVREYLKTERLYQNEWKSIPILLPHLSICNVQEDYIPRQFIIFSNDYPRISWDWYIDPEGHAFEVLREFRNLGAMNHEPTQDYDSPEIMVNWPYFYARWENVPRAVHWWTTTEEMRSSLRTLIKVFENRFERRWLKKMKKLRNAQGIGGKLKMPGAWID